MATKTEQEAKQAERDTEKARQSGGIRTGPTNEDSASAEARNRKEAGGYDQTKGPDGKGTHKTKIVDVTDDEVRKAIDDAIEGFRGKADKSQIVGVLRTAADLLNRSGGWVIPPETLDYDPDDLDDPRANPSGARPAPRGATRADEHTQPEPDSLGTLADRKAAEAGLDDETADDVPPPDREAVAVTRASQKAAEQFGTAGGHPLARAEHKDDPKPKK